MQNEEYMKQYFLDLQESHRELALKQYGGTWRQDAPLFEATQRAQFEEQVWNSGTISFSNEVLEAYSEILVTQAGVQESSTYETAAQPPTPTTPPAPELPSPVAESPEPPPPVVRSGAAPTSPPEPKTVTKIVKGDDQSKQTDTAPKQRGFIDKLKGGVQVLPPLPGSLQPNQPLPDGAGVKPPPQGPQQPPPKPDGNQPQGQQRPPGPRPPHFPQTNSLPFLDGAFRVSQTDNSMLGEPSVNGGDVGISANALADIIETSSESLMTSIERIVMALLKMQGELDEVNEILDRSFGN